MAGLAREWHLINNMRPRRGFDRLKDVLRRLLAVVLLAGLVSGSTAPLYAQEDAQAAPGVPPVSADRVSAGLRRPELEIPPLPLETPTFRAEVTGKLETPLDVVRRELREAAGLPPWKGGGHVTQGVDILPALVGLVAKFRAMRRDHAEAEARQMVQRELAEFCASHDCSQVIQEPLTEGVLIAH